MSDTFTYTLTKEELFSALWHTRRSTARLIGQTVLLLVVGLPALVGLFVGFRDAATFLCGIALPLLAVLQWVLPAVAFRREAAQIAAQNTAITLMFDENTLSVADQTVALVNAELRRVKDLLLWRVAGQWIAIPRRAVSPAAWDVLAKEETA